jgi:pilus assembly protein CpaB
MIQRQKLIGTVVAVLLALGGAGLLITYVRGAEDRALEDEKPTSVLVVSQPIAKGTTSEAIAAMVRTEKIPARAVAEGALTSVASLTGQVAVVDLAPGEQLVPTRFAPAGSAAATGRAEGLLEVTIALDMVRAIGGEVREGDTVGVLASFDDPSITHLVLHKVTVTEVRNQEGSSVADTPDGSINPGGLLITLAIDAPSVEKVVFAAEHGRIWLSREPIDADESGTAVVTAATVNA